MQGKKVLVCGGRNFADYKLLENTLNEMNKQHSIVAIIHGGASGADTLAGKWAISNNIPTRIFPAQWSLHGKAAGPIRNSQMLAEGQPDLVVAFEGGAGTKNMVRQAESKNVPVVEIIKNIVEKE